VSGFSDIGEGCALSWYCEPTSWTPNDSEREGEDFTPDVLLFMIEFCQVKEGLGLLKAVCSL